MAKDDARVMAELAEWEVDHIWLDVVREAGRCSAALIRIGLEWPGIGDSLGLLLAGDGGARIGDGPFASTGEAFPVGLEAPHGDLLITVMALIERRAREDFAA